MERSASEAMEDIIDLDALAEQRHQLNEDLAQEKAATAIANVPGAGRRGQSPPRVKGFGSGCWFRILNQRHTG